MRFGLKRVLSTHCLSLEMTKLRGPLDKTEKIKVPVSQQVGLNDVIIVLSEQL
jgi:hypothetical protein